MRLPRGELILDGRRIGYALRVSGRARWPSLWIAPDSGLVVTSPRGYAPDALASFLVRHRRWVAGQVQRLNGPTLPLRWPYGNTVLYLGQGHELLFAAGAPTEVTATSDRRLVVRMPRPGIAGGRRVLARWLHARAGEALQARTAALAEQVRLRPRRLYVRNLRRRWGGCWPGGSLSFNFRLVMAPPRVLDYVVVHELAHLQEPNHSRRFWTLVTEHDPGCADAKRWLRDFGAWLCV